MRNPYMVTLPPYSGPYTIGWGWDFQGISEGFGYGYSLSVGFQIEDLGFGMGTEDGNGYGGFKNGKNLLNHYPEEVIIL